MSSTQSSTDPCDASDQQIEQFRKELAEFTKHNVQPCGVKQLVPLLSPLVTKHETAVRHLVREEIDKWNVPRTGKRVILLHDIANFVINEIKLKGPSLHHFESAFQNFAKEIRDGAQKELDFMEEDTLDGSGPVAGLDLAIYSQTRALKALAMQLIPPPFDLRQFISSLKKPASQEQK